MAQYFTEGPDPVRFSSPYESEVTYEHSQLVFVPPFIDSTEHRIPIAELQMTANGWESVVVGYL